LTQNSFHAIYRIDRQAMEYDFKTHSKTSTYWKADTLHHAFHIEISKQKQFTMQITTRLVTL